MSDKNKSKKTELVTYMFFIWSELKFFQIHLAKSIGFFFNDLAKTNAMLVEKSTHSLFFVFLTINFAFSILLFLKCCSKISVISLIIVFLVYIACFSFN